jgi:hypothetical protein
MKESQEHRTRLEYVDSDTFTRFAEFIYGGDYNTAEARVVLDDAEVEKPRAESDIPEAEEVHLFDPPPPPEPETETSYQEALEDVVELQWPVGWTFREQRARGGKIPIQKQLPPLASLATFSLPTNNNVSFPKIADAKIRNDALMYDYTEAFCHVRLYAFAEQYQINDLKNLVLRKLHKVLMDTTFHPLRTSELVQLLKLAYESTPELSSREEPLRELLTHYVAWNFEALAPMEDFQHLLEAGGTSVIDICQKACRRL